MGQTPYFVAVAAGFAEEEDEVVTVECAAGFDVGVGETVGLGVGVAEGDGVGAGVSVGEGTAVGEGVAGFSTSA